MVEDVVEIADGETSEGRGRGIVGVVTGSGCKGWV